MTRGEEIRKAFDTIFPIPPSLRRGYEQALMVSGFEAGAQWADDNPKSSWISVEDDLPCNHSDLILTYNDIPFSIRRALVITDIHTLFLCDMKYENNIWIWNYSTRDKVTHWMPIPEISKE